MKVDFRYVYAIAGITWAHLFAAISTYHAVTSHGATESNPVNAMAFNLVGPGPALILMYVIGILLIVSLPFLYKEHEKFQINATTISYAFTFIMLSMDSIHDFLILIQHPYAGLTYAILSGFLSASPYIIIAGIVVVILYYSVKRFMPTKPAWSKI